LQLVADLSGGSLGCARRKLDHKVDLAVEAADTPGLEGVIYAYNRLGGTDVEHINGKAHKVGMYR
jgi:hypothetical protein